MKKKIVVGSFLALILITIIIFIIGTINIYNDEVANDDIVGLGAAIILVIGGFVVFYELDLFYTLYYFFVKPKTIAKSILNVLANLTLVIVYFTDYISHFLFEYVSEMFGEEIILLFALIFTYVILRIASIAIPAGKSTKEN